MGLQLIREQYGEDPEEETPSPSLKLLSTLGLDRSLNHVCQLFEQCSILYRA